MSEFWDTRNHGVHENHWLHGPFIPQDLADRPALLVDPTRTRIADGTGSSTKTAVHRHLVYPDTNVALHFPEYGPVIALDSSGSLQSRKAVIRTTRVR